MLSQLSQIESERMSDASLRGGRQGSDFMEDMDEYQVRNDVMNQCDQNIPNKPQQSQAHMEPKELPAST